MLLGPVQEAQHPRGFRCGTGYPVEHMGHKARLIQYKLYGTFFLLASV